MNYDDNGRWVREIEGWERDMEYINCACDFLRTRVAKDKVVDSNFEESFSIAAKNLFWTS